MTIIGLIPASGKATRIMGLPKMLLPTPDGYLLDLMGRRMVAAGATPLLVAAGAENLHIIGHYIPEHAHLVRIESRSMPETLLKMRPPQDGTVFVGMPDTYWKDDSVFEKLLRTLNTGAMLALGLWKVRPDQRGRLGMVDLGRDKVTKLIDPYLVRWIVDKDPATPLQFAWGAMAWRSEFWQYIKPEDAHLGIAVNRAIEAKVIVRGAIMDGEYWDCGTPESYIRLCSTWHQEAVAHG